MQRRSPLVGRLALTAALVFLAGVLMMSCTREIGDAELLFPQQHPLQPEQADRANVSIPLENGEQLRGWHLHDPAHEITLLYWYGNGETVLTSEYRLEWLFRELGVDVLAVDYRGYGFSDGRATVRAVVEDADLVYEHARQALGADRIVLFGRSIGTAPAIRIAAKQPVDGLILEAPFTSVHDVLKAWQGNLPAPMRWLVRLRPAREIELEEGQPERLIRSYDGPLLVLHGEQDRTIPPALGRAVYEAAGGTNKTWQSVPGTDHNHLTVTQPEVASALHDFIARVKSGD